MVNRIDVISPAIGAKRHSTLRMEGIQVVNELGSIVVPSLSPTSFNVQAGNSQGTDVTVLTPIGNGAIGDITIASQSVPNALQMGSDSPKRTVQIGSGLPDPAVTPIVTGTFQFTDGTGVNTFPFVASILAATRPTIVGTPPTSITMQASVAYAGYDFKVHFNDPTGTGLTYAINPALPGNLTFVNGVLSAVTPNDAALAQTYTVRASNSLLESAAFDVIIGVSAAPVNNAPTLSTGGLTVDGLPGTAPVFSSGTPVDGATGVAVSQVIEVFFDRPILPGTSGTRTVTVRNVTDATDLEVFDVATEQGTTAGKIEFLTSSVKLRMTSNLPGSKNIAIRWSSGFCTNLGGVAVAANSTDTLLDFTTAAVPVAPSQFQDADWSVAATGTSGQIAITITTLPSDGGSSITALQYQLNSGAWVSLGGTTTGTYNVGSLTNGASYNVAVRAVNSVGNGTASNTKSVTPYSSAYSPNKLVADATDYFFASSLGMSDSTSGTIAFLIEPLTNFANAITMYVFKIAGSRLDLRFVNGALKLDIRNTANAVIYSGTAATTLTASSGLTHVHIALDFSATPSVTVSYNGSAITMTVTSGPTAGTIDWTRTAYGILATESAGFVMDRCNWADLYVEAGAIRAVSNFYNGGAPQDISALGSPQIRLIGNAATLNGGTPNSGSATLTLGGSFTDA